MSKYIEQGTIIIYPWELSTTGKWSKDVGRYLLRDLRERSPEELAKFLLREGAEMQISAIEELGDHGKPKKSAEIARALVASNPDVEITIREHFGEEVADVLLLTSLERIFPPLLKFQREIRKQYIH